MPSSKGREHKSTPDYTRGAADTRGWRVEFSSEFQPLSNCASASFAGTLSARRRWEDIKVDALFWKPDTSRNAQMRPENVRLDQGQFGWAYAVDFQCFLFCLENKRMLCEIDYLNNCSVFFSNVNNCTWTFKAHVVNTKNNLLWTPENVST